MAPSVFGDFFEVKAGGRFSKTVVYAVFEPVTFPAIVPSFNEEAGDTEADGGVDVFFGVDGGGAMAIARCPCPFADIHSPPNANKFKSMNPCEILARWIIKAIHSAVSSKLGGGVGEHDETPRGLKWEVEMSLGAIRKWCDVGL